MVAFLIPVFSAWAAKDPKRTIQIDELEVLGDLRKPFLEALDSDQETQRTLKELADRLVIEHEEKLLIFKTARTSEKR